MHVVVKRVESFTDGFGRAEQLGIGEDLIGALGLYCRSSSVGKESTNNYFKGFLSQSHPDPDPKELQSSDALQDSSPC